MQNNQGQNNQGQNNQGQNNQRPQTPPQPRYVTPDAPPRPNQLKQPSSTPSNNDPLVDWALATLNLAKGNGNANGNGGPGHS